MRLDGVPGDLAALLYGAGLLSVCLFYGIIATLDVFYPLSL